MTVIFEKKQSEELTFEDVEENQFFVCKEGFLCQKSTRTEYNIIAKPDGSVYSTSPVSVRRTIKIERLIPKVTKIKF